MNIQQMTKLFEANGVPKSYYTIGELGMGECLGIEKLGDQWHIYYSERGKKTTQAMFPDEDSACRFMIELVDERMVDELGRNIRLDADNN
jgi:hypothetical protein